jgi:hypothetical protein
MCLIVFHNAQESIIQSFEKLIPGSNKFLHLTPSSTPATAGVFYSAIREFASANLVLRNACVAL